MSPEDQLDVFGKYYGLPSLSWRDTVHDLIAHNVSGFKMEDLYFDKGHPNGYNGHRCAGMLGISAAYTTTSLRTTGFEVEDDEGRPDGYNNDRCGDERSPGLTSITSWR